MIEASGMVRGRSVYYNAEPDGRELIDRADQIPHFETEAEEQVWWETHRLSPTFWQTANTVPADQLPPVCQPDKPSTQSPVDMSRAGIVLGIVVGGALVLGAVYLTYLLLRGGSAGSPHYSQFAPTRVPYLRVSA
jgi:hypothetical protein